jgi:hypothetical protein
MTESTQMFLSNLDSMARHIEELRRIDPKQLDSILQEHAWAEDHIATSKDDLQEVTEFMLSYTQNTLTHHGINGRIHTYESWSNDLKK